MAKIKQQTKKEILISHITVIVNLGTKKNSVTQ